MFKLDDYELDAKASTSVGSVLWKDMVVHDAPFCTHDTASPVCVLGVKAGQTPSFMLSEEGDCVCLIGTMTLIGASIKTPAKILTAEQWSAWRSLKMVEEDSVVYPNSCAPGGRTLADTFLLAVKEKLDGPAYDKRVAEWKDETDRLMVLAKVEEKKN